ncbi:MAG TPA: undecaprenyldiphospho-muramoylpentapeptide beta-N-acetylglucosaminyltransferase [Firmicutes bacterium]|nr:undecaprenyldiphospho-muramoylpentapeptide beta-N-acetylglucosaminyltransferase [Bacillota bacterium]
MKRIVLTGGGTAGHVMPHFALLPHLQQTGWEAHYIGTWDGIERELVGDDLPFYPISAGKFRRYFDLKNFTDPFRVLKGVGDSLRILRKINPWVVFSKGGFVAVPVTIAAWMLRIPVVLHESDLSLGLANRLSLPFSRALCVTFPESQERTKNAIVTGTPIRAEIGLGSRRAGLEFCRFSHQLPTLLVMGGSLGSAVLNEIVRVNLDELTASYQIIHLCGRGNLADELKNPRYFQLEYARDELPDLFAAADFAISRAGANAIFELLALAKPHILVPLSLQASRGDQILNAASFARQGFSLVLQEEDLTLAALREQLDGLRRQREKFVSTMRQSGLGDGTQNVLRIIEQVAAGR